MPYNTPSTAQIQTLTRKVWVVSTVLFLYSASVYFDAATASLSDAYQPGLDAFKLCVQPGLWLLLPLLLAYCMKTQQAAQVALWCGIGGLVCCGILFAFCSLHMPRGGSSWVAPEMRTLGRTLHAALLLPSFSNRSLGSIAGSGIFAALQCVLSAVLVIKLRSQPPSTVCI